MAGGNLRRRVENPVQHRLGQPEVRTPRRQKANAMAKHEPTPEQLKALLTYASNNGRFWKRLLRHAWETGDYQAEDDTALLQQVRNSFGPSWLVDFRLPKDNA